METSLFMSLPYISPWTDAVLMAEPHEGAQKFTCLGRTFSHMMQKEHSKAASKHHPNSKVWWRRHGDVELLHCLKTWNTSLTLLSSKVRKIKKITKIFYKIMSEWLCASWSLGEVRWWSRTRTLDIKVNQLQNGFTKWKETRSCNCLCVTCSSTLCLYIIMI